MPTIKKIAFIAALSSLFITSAHADTLLNLRASFCESPFDADGVSGPNGLCYDSPVLKNVELEIYRARFLNGGYVPSEKKPLRTVKTDSQGIIRTRIPNGLYTINIKRNSEIQKQIGISDFSGCSFYISNGTLGYRVYSLNGGTRRAYFEVGIGCI